MKNAKALCMILGVAALCSCSKDELQIDPQSNVEITKMADLEPYYLPFTGDTEIMIHNPEDLEDEEVNVASQVIMEALIPYMANPEFRSDVFNLAKANEIGQVRLATLFDLGILGKPQFHSELMQSERYPIGASIEDWLLQSYFNVVQHEPVIFIPNVNESVVSNNEYFISTGIESNKDFTVDDNGLVYVLHYDNQNLIGEKVINEIYAKGSEVPMFVVSPGMEIGFAPDIPGFQSEITIGEPGDPGEYDGSISTKSFVDKRPLAVYEQLLKKRFERWGGSEIGTSAIWNHLQTISPNVGAILNDTKHTRWYMPKQRVNQWNYKWRGLGIWVPNFTNQMTWNVYEHDWQYSSKEVCSVKNLNTGNVHRNWGCRKYYSECYAFSPSGYGANWKYTYQYQTNHPHLWSTIYVNNSNAKIRVWRVAP